MNLQQTLDILAGGPGSGCNPDVGVCGRPAGSGMAHQQTSRLADGGHARYDAATKTWKQDNGKALPKHIDIRIPPAWQDVRFATRPGSPILVVGVDSKGRIQAVYSKEFSSQQAEAKFERINELDKKLVSIQGQVENDLNGPNKEEAAALRLIMTTGIRPGGEGNTLAEKQAYGATTLLGRHVKGTNEDNVKLNFVGKKGVDISLKVTDKDVARDLLERKNVAGPKGRLFDTSSSKLLAYTHSQDGGDFKTKDFRTLLGTKIATAEVEKVKTAPTDEKSYKKAVKAVATVVAAKLGNTPTIALQSYIHPATFAKWRIK